MVRTEKNPILQKSLQEHGNCTPPVPCPYGTSEPFRSCRITRRTADKIAATDWEQAAKTQSQVSALLHPGLRLVCMCVLPDVVQAHIHFPPLLKFLPLILGGAKPCLVAESMALSRGVAMGRAGLCSRNGKSRGLHHSPPTVADTLGETNMPQLLGMTGGPPRPPPPQQGSPAPKKE